MIGRAWINKNVFNEIKKEANLWLPNETGGVLLGYWSSHDELVITNLIGPGINALHGRHSFSPDAKWQEAEIAKIYKKSGRLITYLGDWHSHPEGAPSLSIRDLVTMFRVAVHKPARAPRPIMGILYNNPKWELVVWRFDISKIVSGVPAIKMEVIWFDEKSDHENYLV